LTSKECCSISRKRFVIQNKTNLILKIFIIDTNLFARIKKQSYEKFVLKMLSLDGLVWQ